MSHPVTLLVEDDDDTRREIAELLEGAFDVIRTGDGASALAALDGSSRVDLVIADLHLTPGIQGPAVALRAAELDIAVLLISADMSAATAFEALGYSVLRKPFGIDPLMRRVRRELGRSPAQRQLLRENLLNLKCGRA